jgi:hypothetical protein
VCRGASAQYLPLPGFGVVTVSMGLMGAQSEGSSSNAAIASCKAGHHMHELLQKEQMYTEPGSPGRLHGTL